MGGRGRGVPPPLATMTKSRQTLLAPPLIIPLAGGVWGGLSHRVHTLDYRPTHFSRGFEERAVDKSAATLAVPALPSSHLRRTSPYRARLISQKSAALTEIGIHPFSVVQNSKLVTALALRF